MNSQVNKTVLTAVAKRCASPRGQGMRANRRAGDGGGRDGAVCDQEAPGRWRRQEGAGDGEEVHGTSGHRSTHRHSGRRLRN